jgi:hypothetical protein
LRAGIARAAVRAIPDKFDIAESLARHSMG